MPELPEVETIVRDLRPLLIGRRIDAVRHSGMHLRIPWDGKADKRIVGLQFFALRRRGKWIIADLSDGAALLFHLGMTGQLTLRPLEEPDENHTHFILQVSPGYEELRFRDVRRFGSVQYIATQAQLNQMLAAALGPEPCDLNPEAWFTSLRQSKRCLKAILLDQAIVAGVGNIYADESLFEAGLAPTRTGNRITREQAERLRRTIIEVLDRAIAQRGTTIRDYIGGSKLRGGYQERLSVYGRDGKPCLKCNAVIKLMRLAGRATHFCARCQPRRSS